MCDILSWLSWDLKVVQFVDPGKLHCFVIKDLPLWAIWLNFITNKGHYDCVITAVFDEPQPCDYIIETLFVVNVKYKKSSNRTFVKDFSDTLELFLA